MGQKNALYFCAGLAIGILGTLGFLWFYELPEPEESKESKKEKPVDLPTLEESMQNITPKVIDDKSTIDNLVVPKEMVDYSSIISKAHYDGDGVLKIDIPNESTEPFRVTEEQFEDGNIDGNYDITGLTLYGNGILADATTDEIMSESDAFTALGPNYTVRRLQEIFARAADYTDDPIYIRNNNLFTQYEISYDKRTYTEVTGRNRDGSYGT